MIAEQKYAIETISLTKVFPDWWGRAKVVALENLDLRVCHNEIYGFLGPNGSGKTTTIKMLLNLLHPTKGAAFVLGAAAGDSAASARIGYLPEESYLYPYLTARETLDFYGRIFGLPGQVRKARIDTLLDMVGLSGMGHRQIGTYSKGMARRIGLAQALINDPDLLILDEPTSGMDPMGTRQMKDLFIELARRGKTILLCSHLLADVEDVCDRIGILYGGRMQIEGTVKDLLQQKNETQIRTGKLSEDALDKIRSIAASEGSEANIENPIDKLESFFVRTVNKAHEEAQKTSGAEAGTGISGFLADKPVVRTANVLDELVSAQVDEIPAKEEQQISTTVAVNNEPVPISDTDSGLLDKLTQHQVDSSTDQVKQKLPEKSVSDTPAVKKDVLDGLIKKTDSGKTEPTRSDSDSKEDTEDA